MKNVYIAISLKRAFACAAFATLPLAASAQPMLDQAHENAQENHQAAMEELQSEFTSVKSQLEEIQAKALEQEEVQEAISSVDEALKSAMLEEAPDRKQDIDEYFQLREEFARMEADGGEDLSEAKAQEFNQLHQDLSPLMTEVADSEEVAAARDESREVVLSAMTEVDPETPILLNRQQELVQRYQRMQQGL